MFPEGLPGSGSHLAAPSARGTLRDLPGAAVGGQGGLLGQGASGGQSHTGATQGGCSVAQVVQCAGYSQKWRKFDVKRNFGA